MKILKSKKALSPVVASIILIAVTVAVSIAVAAWMGALTFSFMGSSSISITDVSFEGTSGDTNSYINITVKNTGTNQVTIAQVTVNDYVKTTNPTTLTLDSGISGTIKITQAWTAGNPYKIELFDASNTGVGSTQKTAS